MLVRPHLKCCAWFWATYCKRDIRLFKYMQRTTRSMKGLENNIHDEWLRELRLFNLEKMRLRGDLITPCICLKEGCCKEDTGLFSQVASWRTWGTGLKLSQERFRLDIRKKKYLHKDCLDIGTGYPGEYRVSIPRDTSETNGCGA